MSINVDDPDISHGADLSAPLLASLIASATAAATVSSTSSSNSATASTTPRRSKTAEPGTPTDSTLASTPASTPVDSPNATPTVSRNSSRSSSPTRHHNTLPPATTSAGTGTGTGSGIGTGTTSAGQAINKRFPHYKAPSVESYPVLVQMCEHCLDADDSPGLAAIARSRGLPAQLRSRAWPLLLQSHPHVLHPRLFPAAEGALDIQEPPIKRIKGDIARLLTRVLRTRRVQNSAPGSMGSSLGSSGNSSPHDSHSPSETTHSLSTLSSPSSASSSSSSPTLASPKYDVPNAVVVESIERSVLQFVRRYGSSAPYERGMVWVAYTLAQAMGTPLDPQVFENVMLVFLHTSEKESETEQQSDSLSQTVSYFLALIRAALPALGQHFDQECMLGFLANEEWLLWWIKWFGARAFAVDNAARLWDSYFGYRELCSDTLEPREEHVFNCLSVLNAVQFRLMELDQSEMRQMLLHLPPCDMELVVTRAEDLKIRAKERERAAELASA